MTDSTIIEKYFALGRTLVSERNPDGFWTGSLSESALSTAVASVALKAVSGDQDKDRVEAGFNWLIRNINNDGGYGDTPGSVSNVSTTLLCYAAVSYCRTGDNGTPALEAMGKWLSENGILIDPRSITRTLLKYYGSDLTFSVPILSMLHLCGVIPSAALRNIPVLPFELTLLPLWFYRFVNLRVVSYALPALIGVGIYLNRKRGKNWFRNMFIKPAVRKLDTLVPESGGFLEAIPLTGFVAMCLHTSGETENKTVGKGISFLHAQQRPDGAWPIDTDLSTWVTTLAVKALGNDLKEVLDGEDVNKLRGHILNLQYRSIHPFNGAGPGGWGWTSFSGSVPDADDTAGAIIALLELYSGSPDELEAVERGCEWLIDLQNSDGGFPTFCRGWGRLPFDRSCADLSGHALLALLKAIGELGDQMPGKLITGIEKCIAKTISYLTIYQSDEGAWLPLWFGNQQTAKKTNPVYGTAKVCTYLNDCLKLKHLSVKTSDDLKRLTGRARSFIVQQQNTDGSWGGEKGIPGTIEETSLAICSLARSDREACMNGIKWLEDREITPAPIGLYFATLWYDEKLYPLIYYTEALRRFLDES